MPRVLSEQEILLMRSDDRKGGVYSDMTEELRVARLRQLFLERRALLDHIEALNIKPVPEFIMQRELNRIEERKKKKGE